MDFDNKEIDALEPLQLEEAYRDMPDVFRHWLLQSIEQHPDNVLLKAWHVRLFYDELEFRDKNRAPVKNLLLYTVLISTIAWAIAKIPAFITVDDSWFYSFSGAQCLDQLFHHQRAVQQAPGHTKRNRSGTAVVIAADPA